MIIIRHVEDRVISKPAFSPGFFGNEAFAAASTTNNNWWGLARAMEQKEIWPYVFLLVRLLILIAPSQYSFRRLHLGQHICLNRCRGVRSGHRFQVPNRPPLPRYYRTWPGWLPFYRIFPEAVSVFFHFRQKRKILNAAKQNPRDIFENLCDLLSLFSFCVAITMVFACISFTIEVMSVSLNKFLETTYFFNH